MKRNSWSSWTEYLNLNTDTLEEKLVSQAQSNVMKLQLKDMNLFGYCPEYDDFYLVICQICGKRLKPQSLNSHIELRHKKMNLHKLSLSGSLQQASLTYIPPNCSNESSKNNLSNMKNSAMCSLSGGKDKLRVISNKKQTVYVQPYPRPDSMNSCQRNNTGKLTSFSPSSDIVRTALARSTPENHYYDSLKKDACIKMVSSPESSSSTCDSQTSMTVFLHHSFVMPNIKLCDIKNRCNNHLHCLSSKTLPKSNCLPNATILTQVLPEKKGRRSIRSPRQGSQVNHQNKEVDDWNSIQNSTNLGLNGMSYTAWNQHSAHFRPLPCSVPMGNSEQMNSHSFNCSDLTKKFGDLESQVLIHNAAMGT